MQHAAYRSGAAFQDLGPVEILVIFDSVAIFNNALSATVVWWRIVRSQRVWMYLDAVGSTGGVVRPHLVQAEHFASRVVKLVVVDLDVRKSGIKLHVDIALPGCEFEGSHYG